MMMMQEKKSKKKAAVHHNNVESTTLGEPSAQTCPELRLTKVHFGDGCAWTVDSPEYTYAFRAQINHLCRLTQNNMMFPAPLPWTLDRTLLETQLVPQKDQFLWSPKADGKHYFLFFVSLFQYTESFVVLVDRSWKMWLIQLETPRGMCDGTLIDGELVQDSKGRHYFLAFDVLASFGADLILYSFAVRRQVLQRLVPNLIRASQAPFQVYLKPFYPLSTLVKHVTSTPVAQLLGGVNCRVDGIIFSKMHDAICLGSDDTSLKFKPTWYNTVEFFLDIDHDATNNEHVKLYSYDDVNKRPVLFTSQTLEETNCCDKCRNESVLQQQCEKKEEGTMPMDLFPTPSDLDIVLFASQIVEFFPCPFHRKKGVGGPRVLWHHIARRGDKNYPNKLSVAQQIHDLVLDKHVSFRDLMECLKSKQD